MKKRYFLLALFLFPLLFQAQTTWDKAGVQQMLDAYFEKLEKKDMVGTLDYIHPQLFELVPRKILEEQIANTFADPSMNLGMHDYAMKGISKLKMKEGISYGRVDYSFIMEVQLLNDEEEEVEQEEVEEEGYEDEDESEEGKDAFMQAMFEAQYGKDNVSYEEETRTFLIAVESSMFVIGDPAIGEWKMIENKIGAEELLLKILPQKIYKKLR